MLPHISPWFYAIGCLLLAILNWRRSGTSREGVRWRRVTFRILAGVFLALAVIQLWIAISQN